MSKEDLQLGSEVIQSLFENGNSPLSLQFIRWKLWRKWPEIVGPTMATVCEPVGFINGTLFIWVKSSTWMQQMVFMIDPMKAKVNKFLNQNYVSQIRYTLNKHQLPTEAEQVAQLKHSLSKISK
jgi:hypothetical protein